MKKQTEEKQGKKIKLCSKGKKKKKKKLPFSFLVTVSSSVFNFFGSGSVADRVGIFRFLPPLGFLPG